MTEVRNILLIGRSGSGKSALANILSQTDNFEESNSGNSKTKEIKTAEFEVEINNKKVKYKIIDTVGFNDTDLETKQTLGKIQAVSREIRNGLNQILFVSRGRFDEDEIKTFNILKNTIFSEEIDNYTTIVRTGFDNFDEEEECKKEIENLEKNKWYSQISKSCNGILFVNNPSLNQKGETKKQFIPLYKEIRKLSRKILLDHLIYKCNNNHPLNLEGLIGRIGSYLTEKEELEKKIEEERKTYAIKDQEYQAQIEDLTRKKDLWWREYQKAKESNSCNIL